jgi:hypothetical protein
VAKLVARLLAMASLKNTKWATEAKEWQKHSSRHKKKKTFLTLSLTGVGPFGPALTYMQIPPKV